MRCLKRNKVLFYYCLYDHSEEIIDEYGNHTGQYINQYSDPVKMYANVSPATGISSAEQFGNLENYDKVIVTDWMECPIDENSVLFIDKPVEFADAETNEIVSEDTVLGTSQTVQYLVPKFDYTVRRVAKSLNIISIAVQKVTVS